MKTFYHLPVLMLPFALLFGVGCATTTGSSGPSVQENEDILLLREDVNRCNDRLKTMELEQRRIIEEIRELRNRGGDDGTRARLDELERRVTALDAARMNDRQAIIDQVAKIVSSGGAASRPLKSSAGGTSSSGIEHVVKDGETLSSIAAVYKVKPVDIIAANDLKNPDLLRKGQKLVIPQ